MTTKQIQGWKMGKVAQSAHRRQAERRTVIALTAIAMLAMLDRYALSLFVAPLKDDLQLSDAQVGAAVGTGFAIAHVAVTIPAGWIGDRWNRQVTVFSGVLIWSLMTMLCGRATTFWSFLIARAAVGLGEGLIPPASYSLIHDAVPRERQGRAFGTFAMANTLGPGSAILLGGIMLSAITAHRWDTRPIIGHVQSWQLVLLALGAMGAPMAGLAFTFPMLPRKTQLLATTYADAMRVICNKRAVFIPLIVFAICCAMVSNALAIWFPAYVGRTWHLAPEVIGPRLGLLLIIVGPAGLLAAGAAMDALGRHGPAGQGIVALGISLLLLVCSSTVSLAPSQSLMWVLEGGVIFCSTCYFAVVSTVVSQTVPQNVISKVMALILVLQGVIGGGLSPLMVGWLADRLFTGEGALGMALSITSITIMLCASTASFILVRGRASTPLTSSPLI